MTLMLQNFLDVVVELEKLDKVSSDSVDMIEQCLRNVGRVDLAKKVNLYQSSGESANYLDTFLCSILFW